MFLWSKVYLETDKSPEEVEKLLKENTKEMPNFILFWEKEPKFLFCGKVEKNGFLLKQTDKRGASYKGIVVDKNNKSIIVFWRKWRKMLIIFYCFLFYTVFKNYFFYETSIGFNFIFLVGLIILIIVDHCDEKDLKIKLQNLLSAHELKM